MINKTSEAKKGISRSKSGHECKSKGYTVPSKDFLSYSETLANLVKTYRRLLVFGQFKNMYYTLFRALEMCHWKELR